MANRTSFSQRHQQCRQRVEERWKHVFLEQHDAVLTTHTLPDEFPPITACQR